MKNKFTSIRTLSKNEIIKNARPDCLEVLLLYILENTEKSVVFINENLKIPRIIQNFKFLTEKIDIIELSDKSEIYNYANTDAFDTATKILNISTLLKDNQKMQKLILIDYKFLLRKLPENNFFLQTKLVKVGERFGYSNLLDALYRFGFTKVETVYELGEFAARGFIVDIGTLQGFFRIEFNGEEIASISKFNTETQRKEQLQLNTNLISEISIIPIKEVVLSEENLLLAKSQVHNLELEFGKDFFQRIHNFYSMSLHNFLPLFYKSTTNTLSFLPKNVIFVSNKNLDQTLKAFEKNVYHSFLEQQNNGKSVLHPNLLFESADNFLQKLEPMIQLSYSA